MIQTVGSVSFSDYTSAIKAGNKQHIKIVFTNQNKTIYESQISIDGLDYTCHLNPDEDIDYGTAVMTQIEADLINKDGTLSDIDFTQEFAVFLGVEINGNTVWQQIGIFNGEQPNKTHDEIIHLTGYDRMRKMEIPSNEFFKQEPEGKTLAQYFADICLFCGVTAASIPVHAVNVGRTYDRHPTTGEGLTCRDIISMLAEAMGCHVRFNYDGQCQLIWFTDTAYEIPQGWPYSLDIAEYEAPAVDRLQVKSTDNDVGVIVPDTSLGKNSYELVNNPFLFGTSDEDVRPSATALYNKINGFGTYVPAVVEEDGTWLIEAGDIITYTDQLGNSRSLAIFTVHIHWNGRADITYESTGNRQRQELTAQNRQALQLGWRFHEVINSIDELKSIIGSLDFSKVYVQLQDPVETAEELHVGDMWVKAEDPWQTWEDAQPYTWQEAVDNHIWAGNLGSETYSWDGSQWIPVSSQAMLVAQQTAIEQNAQHISLIAERTADIEGTVARESARIDVTSQRITQEVERATDAENGKIAKTTQYQTAQAIVDVAVLSAGMNAANSFIAKTTIYQSATDIVATAEAYTDNNAYKIQSGIAINANGIEVSGSKYVKIKSGGLFSVDSGNFSIDANGNVSMTGTIEAASGHIGGWYVGSRFIGNGPNTSCGVGLESVYRSDFPDGASGDTAYSNKQVFWAGYDPNGTPRNKFYVTAGGYIFALSGRIGGWYLGADSLYSGSGAGYVALNSDTSATYAIWAGNNTASSAPFRVKRDGSVYLTSLYAVGEDGTETSVNLYQANLWKLGYGVIKRINGNTVETTLGNFNTAASVNLYNLQVTQVAAVGNRYLVYISGTLTNGNTFSVQRYYPDS